MKILIILISTLIYNNAYCQEKGPVKVTPPIESEIRAGICKSAAKLKNKLERANAFPEAIEFALDTFAVNRYMYEYVKHDYSTSG